MKTLIGTVKGFRLSVDAVRKTVIAAGLVALVAIAFFLGRKGALSEAQAQGPGDVLEVGAAPASDHNQRVVAYIHGSIPITREELGEYLIARFGAERVEFLVNRRIVDMACKAANIFVTDAEINAQLQEDVRNLGPGITLQDFQNSVLRRFNKTLYEWKEDVIRPKLQVAKLVRPTITITAEDLKKAFEARYHDKVECRMIVLEENDRQRSEKWERASKSEAEFNNLARTQFIQSLAATGGKVPPIHKHFGDARIEKEVFGLKDGQVSSLMEMPDKTFVIFKRDKLIPVDTKVRQEDVHLKLHNEIVEFKLAQEIPKVFNQLRGRANPQIYLRPQPRQQDLERAAQQALQNRPADTMIRPASTDPK